jgi:hypothetical protein
VRELTLRPGGLNDPAYAKRVAATLPAAMRHEMKARRPK